MKVLFDLLPVVAFFVLYKLSDIYVATVAAIVASLLQVGFLWFRHRRVEAMHLVTLAIIVVFGGATIVLHDPTFIKWKPTILQWLFALVFLGSHWVGEKPVVRRMLEKQMPLPEHLWIRLSAAWVGFFLVAGGANLYVAFHYDENTWVNFKLFGLMGLTMLFIIGQTLFLMPYLQEVEVKEGDGQGSEAETVPSPSASPGRNTPPENHAPG